jgi:cell volume regulation protein A
VIALVARGQEIIPPQGSTRIKPGDHVVLVLRPQTRSLVNQIFASTRPKLGELPAELEFPLRGTTTVAELEAIYGVDMDAAPEHTLDEAIRQRLDKTPLNVGALVRYGPIALRIRGLSSTGKIEHVGMIVLPETHAQTMSEEAHDNSGRT